MSYVEKAFWDYLKSMMFGGVRILLSRRLILFSLILFVTSAVTTGVVVLQNQASDIITENLIDLVFSVQISIAIGFILSGLFSKKLNLFLRFLLLLLVTVVVVVFTTFSTLPINYFPVFSLLLWAFLVPLATFSFSKGLFSSKITGSVLFLGKPTTDRKSIFSGLMTLIAFLSLIWNLIMVYIGYTETRLSYMFLGILGIGVAFLVILVVQGLILGDDVFNTTLGFFFVVSLPNQIMIFITSISGSENIVTSFNYIMVLFSLIYSAQNVSRRIKMKGVVIDPSKKSKKKIKEDPFRIGRFIGFVGGEGVVLICLGLALGFQVFQLQLMSGELPGGVTNLIGDLTFSEIYHDITMVFMAFILIIVILFYIIQGGSGYWATDIYRFDFLPPYDDLVDYMERIKRGEISKTDIALTVGKRAVEAGGIGVFSTAKKFRKLVFGRKQDSERQD
ncbi:MAG: hypothetical protein ACFE95_12435 [Candidatus Hodarchaeota archaeon]